MTGATANPWIASLDPQRLNDALAILRQQAANADPIAMSCMKYASGDEHFALYLRMADRRCRRMIGLGIFDLGDVTWRDWYDDGLTVGEAVQECIANDDTFGSLIGDMFGGE